MTSARNQPFYQKHNINMGCYERFRLNPRKITERNISLDFYKNPFSLIWEPQAVSFNKATEKLKLIFKIVDKVISDKHVESFPKYQYKPKKINLN